MEFEGVDFSIKEKFLDGYKRKRVVWGPLGSFVFYRTYARELDGGGLERWWQTVRRVVEGCYLIQKRHCKQQFVLWDERQAQKSSQAMYDAIFNFRFLPPGRGLWAMGTEFMFRQGGTCLNNCGFVSTEDLSHDFSGPFTWLAEMSMLGVGVGFDTEGAFGKEILLRAPRVAAGENFVVEDSRQGWVAAFRRVLDSFVGKDTLPESFDYSAIRQAGAPIKGFGGVAPGPEPLQKLIERSRLLLDEYVKEDKPIDSRLIVDLMNFAGAAVVAGGVRRSAEIAVGRPDDLEYVGLKSSETIENPNLARWASNNSVFARVGMDYRALAEKSATAGEPGYIWLENARAFGRTSDDATHADRRARGTNPCQPGWATVLTPQGIQTFDEVGIGDLIWTGKRWAAISAKYATGTKEVSRYHTTAGCFVGTEDHRVVSAGRKIRVADASTLTSCAGPDGGPTGISFNIKEIEACGLHPVYDITVDDADHTYWTGGVLVSNCGEQTLESYETCCLVETFPSLHANLDEYKQTLKYAYLYAKSVTLMPTHDPRTNAVMFRNRRIGLSQTGIIENVVRVGLREHLRWCEEGYREVRRWDDVYSDWLCIPRSIKVTTVKPSGTVSLLPGVTPGIHFPHAEYYIRRIRVSKTSDVWMHYEKAGYVVIPDVYADNTMVIEFPVKENNFTRGKDDVSMWEQFALAAALQRHWSDNAVSITVTIQPNEAKDLASALSMYESQLKSVSFLPVRGDQVYALAPYESISSEVYKQRVAQLRPVNFDAIDDMDKKEERFCDGEVCTL